jgi:hypothetical protein
VARHIEKRATAKRMGKRQKRLVPRQHAMDQKA